MAQLSGDGFVGAPPLTLDAARAMIEAQIGPVEGTEQVGLLEADGRVLAADIAATVDLPPFDNSAVDGYAVRLPGLEAGGRLPVRGRLAAGAVAEPLAEGSARRIFTGAPLPPGADTVFMQEDVRLDAGHMEVPPGQQPGANTRRRGEDIARGAIALRAGLRLRPQDLALAAALGIVTLPVRRRVRMALFSTGNELVEPGSPAGPAQRHDSNRVLLAAMARRAGAQVTDCGILPDRLDAITGALRQAARGHDLVLTSGGVSAGEEDHVRAAVEAMGRLAFWRLGVKPGRPVAMGVLGGVPFMGLPGNPVAAFVTFAQLAHPMLAALAGSRFQPSPVLRVPSAFAWRKKAGLREYVRARLLPGPDGLPMAHKHGVDGSAILTSLTQTDGLIELVEDVTQVSPGDVVAFLPYGLLF